MNKMYHAINQKWYLYFFKWHKTSYTIQTPITLAQTIEWKSANNLPGFFHVFQHRPMELSCSYKVEGLPLERHLSDHGKPCPIGFGETNQFSSADPSQYHNADLGWQILVCIPIHEFPVDTEICNFL